jgi:hypothetical protein
MNVRSIVVVISIIAFRPGLAVAVAVRPPHYRIQARVDAVRHLLEADVLVTGLDQMRPGGLLYLHKGARIGAAKVDGRPAVLRLATEQPAGNYMPESVPLLLPDGPHESLELHYSFSASGMINDVNVISPDLVELALYASWYPVSSSLPRFTYDLTLELPAGWTVVANAQPSGSSTATARAWRSIRPVADVAVVAWPDLRLVQAEREGILLQIAASGSLGERLRPVLDRAHAALGLASSWFGSPSANGRLCLVFPPRKGWGYSRIPLIVTNSAYGESLAAHAGEAGQRLKGVYHEMAHFWWSVANADSADDWINEALAEYTAWRLVREQAGSSAVASDEATYRKDALGKDVAVPIVASREEPARYVNCYEKGALVFIGVERRFGWSRLQVLLRRVVSESQTTPMTTPRFLALCRDAMGAEAAEYVRTLIEAPGWTPALLDTVPGPPSDPGV